jgi:hypothetical protein
MAKKNKTFTAFKSKPTLAGKDRVMTVPPEIDDLLRHRNQGHTPAGRALFVSVNPAVGF